MFSKKRIINYNYLNCIQTNGSVIKLFDSISNNFITNTTYYLNFNLMGNNLKKQSFLKTNNYFFSYFNKKKNNYFNLFNKHFLKKKINFSDNWYDSKPYNNTFFLKKIVLFNFEKKDKKGKTKKKIKQLFINKECVIFNNLFIIKILNKFSKKIMFNSFFNI